MGAQVVFVAAEKRQGVHKPGRFLARHPISYPFLLDEDRRVTKAYGLYHGMGLAAFRIAHPATLVIDRESRVRYVYRGDHQLDRAPLAEVLEAVRKLADRKMEY